MNKKILILALFIFILAAFFQQNVPHKILGWYLSPADTLTQADAIVVVSGDGDRMKHAIDLYKLGFAPKMILSGAAKEGFTSNALAMHIEASRAGVPNEAVITEDRAYNTFENALYTKEIVLSNKIRNIILVSSPYHQRRVYETFRSVFRESEVKLQNSPSPYSAWKIDSWWESEREAHLTQDETLKILWAIITGNYK